MIPGWAKLRADLVLGALGVLFGSVSLTFPLGHDVKGLYHYVAREWVRHGSVPYKDVFDHKPPGIYILHAATQLLFGDGMWGIRVVELLLVVVLGLLAAALTCDARVGEAPRPGVRGAAVFSASFLYFGFLDFWNTAQSELWYATLGITSVWAVTRIERERSAHLAGGAFAAMALLMKPPSMCFILVALAALALRARASREHRARAALRAVLLFGAGAGAVLALVLGYFVVKGAMGAMIDVVIRANAYYVTHEGGVDGRNPVAVVVEVIRFWSPVAPLFGLYLVAALGLGIRRKDAALRDRYLLSAALLAAGFFAYLMQGKLYLLHVVSMVPPAVVLAANVAADCSRAMERELSRINGPAVLVMACLALYPFTPHGAQGWWEETEAAVAWLSGRMPRDTFNDTFRVPHFAYSFQQVARVGEWLRERTGPDDYVAVRGFQPEVYAVAHRRYPGRFFWTTFLVAPSRAYRREEWLAEDRDALRQRPPRYAVTLTGVPDGPDSSAWFEAMGYRTCMTMGDLTILERGPTAP